MKKIDLLGVEVKHYTLKEELKQASIYLYKGGLHTITYLSIQMILQSLDNAQQKKLVEEKDLLIYGEVAILEATNSLSRNRVKEIEGNEFLLEFMDNLVRNQKRICLIGQTQLEIDQLESYLQLYNEDVKISCTFTMDIEKEGQEALINDINDVVPHVIVSRLPNSFQHAFIDKNRKLINANIWLTVLEDSKTKLVKKSKIDEISAKLGVNLFKKKVNKYDNKKDGE